MRARGMKNMRITRLLQLAFAVVTASAALAGPITFTLTGNVTGTLGGTAFTNAAMTVTSVADTSNVFFIAPNNLYEVLAASSSISIAGLGTATFTDQTFWEDPNGSGDIIFGVPGGAGFFNGILGFGFLGVGLESYNLESSFGPVSGPDFEVAVFDACENIPTTAGLLSIPQASNSSSVNGVITTSIVETFTAVTGVPEPTPVVLLGSSLAFICLIGLLRCAAIQKASVIASR